MLAKKNSRGRQAPEEADRLRLVMIHGAGQSAGLWRAQVAGLSPTVEALALDLPGHGTSTWDKGRHGIAAYADYVLDALAGTPLQYVVLCGHSMGGAVVQRLLLDHTRLFRAGILVNTGARLRVRREFLDLIEQDYAQFVDLIYCQCVAPGNQTPSLQDHFRKISECPADVALSDFLACDRFDAMDQIGRIQVPVLAVGAEQDRLTPVKYSAYLADNIPGARLRILPATGHYAPLENPTALNGLIAEFLAFLTGSAAADG